MSEYKPLRNFKGVFQNYVDAPYVGCVLVAWKVKKTARKIHMGAGFVLLFVWMSAFLRHSH